jgi:diaminohydroxyphosphoribosylaminopyrimidine deaminase/5-amino-6-(5-phosphoribosylamino)uracil reductase
MASGESQWITGPEARADVQRLRAHSCAIITGIGTVLDDNPSLNVRDSRFHIQGSENFRQPLRVIVDSNLRIDVKCTMVMQSEPCMVVFAANPDEYQKTINDLHGSGVETLHCPGLDGKVDVKKLLEILAQRECNEVMLEAGARLTGVFLQQRLVDEIIYYIAPTLLGSSARAQVELPLEKMTEQMRLDVSQIRQVGDDIRIIAKPRYLAQQTSSAVK